VWVREREGERERERGRERESDCPDGCGCCRPCCRSLKASSWVRARLRKSRLISGSRLAIRFTCVEM
jgi:hypothetical protein